jgi:hypothetical protein
MCRNFRSIEWYQETYVQISWDYPFKSGVFPWAYITAVFKNLEWILEKNVSSFYFSQTLYCSIIKTTLLIFVMLK